MQTANLTTGKNLVLFCEECGQRNNYADKSKIEEQGGYRCEFCDFFTPLYTSSVLQDKSLLEGEQGDAVFFCQPMHLDFDSISSEHGATKHLIVSGLIEDKPVDVDIEVFPQLSDTISIIKIDNQIFGVTILPVTDATVALVEYEGAGLLVRDNKTGKEVEIDISFHRTGPNLVLENAQINLGRILAGTMVKEHFSVENTGEETLHLEIIPDPNYYSIATQFTIDSPPSISLSPGENVLIPFVIWPTEEICANWNYFQPIGLRTNEIGKNNSKNIVVTCVITQS